MIQHSIVEGVFRVSDWAKAKIQYSEPLLVGCQNVAFAIWFRQDTTRLLGLGAVEET